MITVDLLHHVTDIQWVTLYIIISMMIMTFLKHLVINKSSVMKKRDFIQEMITLLRFSSTRIHVLYKTYTLGKITKEQFEEGYRHVLVDHLKEEIESEIESPNNGCEY
jgi:hypothetical protein